MAIRTISNTGGNWNSPGTWVGGVVPASLDDVVATATSGNLTVTANASIASIDFTNYVSTFSVNSGVTLSFGGNTAPLRMVPGMTIAPTSTGTLSFATSSAAGAPLRSGGLTWPGSLLFQAPTSRNYILGDAWIIDGNLTFRSTLSANISLLLTNFSIRVRGNVTIGDTASATLYPAVGGTTTLILDTSATTTITTNNTTTSTVVPFRTPLSINAPTGTIVFSTPGAKLALGNVTYTSGSVTTTGSTIHWNTAQTLTTSLMTWNSNIVVTGTILSLASALNVGSSGSLTLLSNCQFTTSAVNLSGNMSTGSGTHSGTSTFNIVGATSTISQNAGGAFRLAMNINSSGTVTFSTDFNFGASGISFTYTSGTFSMSNTLTWTNSQGTTTYNMNASGLTFPNFVTSAQITFQGTAGCNFYGFLCITPGTIISLNASRTYNVSNQFQLIGTAASPILIASTVPVTNTILTILPTATLNVAYVNATRIDSSLGQTVWDYAGVLSNTINWNPINPQPPNLSAVFA